MSKIEPLEFLKETKTKIDSYIFDFLPTDHKQPEVRRFYKMMLDYPQRSGKMLRPAFCLLMCEAFGGNPKDAFNTAADLSYCKTGCSSTTILRMVRICAAVNRVYIRNTVFL